MTQFCLSTHAIFNSFSLIKNQNASQAAEKVNSVDGADAVKTNHAQFHRLRSGNFEVKDAKHLERPIIENNDTKY